jgi:hypothetical protein
MQNKKLAVFLLMWLPVAVLGQGASVKRLANGVPDIQGVWQVMNTANWNLEDHIAEQGAVESLGAIGAVLPGSSVVTGKTIPYLPESLAQREANFAGRRLEDPEAKCFMPGIPRATYLPQPFQIFQTDSDIFMAYQFAGAVRNIYMSDHMEAPIDSWMGWSNGHWEGDSLVVEVAGLNPNWLDRAGNFYTSTAKITERFTPLGANHMQYEATIDDPEVFARAWTISMPLYRHVEDNARLFEFKCPEFAEEIMYNHLKRENYLRDAGFPVDGDSDE